MNDLEKFKFDCLHLSPDIVVQKYLIEGNSYFFQESIRDLDEEFLFKKGLANSLDLHIRDIVIVGSAKLGFSLKPDKDDKSLYPYKPFDEDIKNNIYAEKSDIDVAIISGELFDLHLFKLCEHTNAYRDFVKVKNFGLYAKYLLKGWIRPDMTPSDYVISNEIKNELKIFMKKYDRKISFGIYKSWYYFEQYHINNINTIRTNLQYAGD